MTLTWDGGTAVGPVCLGMTGAELTTVLPGRVEEPTDLASFTLAENGFVWDSGELGLNVTVADGVVVAVQALREFLHDGVNLIGLPVAEALRRTGGEVSRDEGEVDIVLTGSGIELYCRGDEVSSVAMADFDLVQD